MSMNGFFNFSRGILATSSISITSQSSSFSDSFALESSIICFAGVLGTLNSLTFFKSNNGGGACVKELWHLPEPIVDGDGNNTPNFSLLVNKSKFFLVLHGDF